MAILGNFTEIWQSEFAFIAIRLNSFLGRWTYRKNEETCLDTAAGSQWVLRSPPPPPLLDTFEVKGLRKILQVLWTTKKTNEWVLNKAGVKRELLDTVKARKLAYCGHTMRKQGSCLDKDIMQGTMPGSHRRGRPHTAWMDNINT